MKIVCPPDGSVLEAAASANQKWVNIFGEWTDNSLDAGASTVSFEFGRDWLNIADDGTGCDDPIKMVRLGAHARHSTTRLGRYGIGGKEAALWVGGVDSVVSVATVHEGRRHELHVDWREYSRAWELDTPSDTPAEAGDGGTTILVRPCARRPPSGKAWRELLDELGYLYSPAIKRGKQIKFRRGAGALWEPLVRWEPPPLSEHIDTRIVVNGRGARVYCGIVEGANPRSGFTYLHAWRVIEAASANGCGGYSASRICGFVDLDESWPLTKNKDAIRKDRDELYAEVARVCEPVLKKAETMARELSSQQFELAVSRQLNEMLASHRAKAKRERGEKTGTQKPTGEGASHKRAKKEQAGQRFPAHGGNGYRISPVRLGRPGDLGQVKPPEVQLNIDNPVVARVWRNDDLAVVIIAASLIAAEHIYAPGGQLLLRDLPQGVTTADFSRAAGTILATTPSLVDRPALRVVS